MDSDSWGELFDSSLNTVNVSVNTELPMDSSSSPKEEEKISFIFMERWKMMISINDGC